MIGDQDYRAPSRIVNQPRLIGTGTANCNCEHCRAIRAEYLPAPGHDRRGFAPVIAAARRDLIMRGIDMPGRIVDDVDPASR